MFPVLFTAEDDFFFFCQGCYMVVEKAGIFVLHVCACTCASHCLIASQYLRLLLPLCFVLRSGLVL